MDSADEVIAPGVEGPGGLEANGGDNGCDGLGGFENAKGLNACSLLVVAFSPVDRC